MADSDKNILITPKTGVATDLPSVVYTGFDNDPVTLEIKDDNTLMWRTSTDVLFSVTPFSVDDSAFAFHGPSGIPQIQGKNDGTVLISTYYGATVIGKITGRPLTVNYEETGRTTIGYTPDEITAKSNISVTGNFQSSLHVRGQGAGGYNAICLTNVTTNNTNKGSCITSLHYNNDGNVKPWMALGTWSTSTENIIYLGGGGWSMPDATEVRFYTGTSATTDGAASLRWKVINDGHFLPHADRTYNIGSSDRRVNDIYADGIIFNYNTNSGNTGGANSISGSDRYVSRNTAVSYSSNMYGQWPQKHLGRFELRGYTAGNQAGGQYLHLKINQPMSSNMMFWRAEGYLYNRGNIWSRAGCYPYAPSNSILSLYINNAGNQTIDTMYRASDGYLVVRFNRGSTGYSEGRFDFWLSGHSNGSYTGKDVIGIGYTDSTSFF